MASSNIKLFDENKGNMLSDSEFSISNQRLNGLQTGVASSQLQNKAMYQASLVAYAIAQVMMQNGLNANDTDAVSTFVANLSGTMLQKVYDVATTAEAQAGVATGKWMSPALVKAAIDTLAAKAQNVLSDTTKALYGLDPSAVPDDAFVEIKQQLSEKVNPNLLDNWYFGNPVDQRGGYVVPPGVSYYSNPVTSIDTPLGTTDKYYTITSYMTNWSVFVKDGVSYSVPTALCVRGYTGAGYTIDRWYTAIDNGTVVVEDDGVLLVGGTTGETWIQKMEQSTYKQLVGKTVTLSVLYTPITTDCLLWMNTNNGFLQPNIALNGNLNAKNCKSVTLVVPDGKTEFYPAWFYVPAGKSVRIHAVKLELGDQQTLAHLDANGNWVLNEIPNKSEEEFKCIHSKADPNDIYANKDVTAGMQIDLLWENASPTSSFPESDISIPKISNYKMIAVIFGYSTDYHYHDCQTTTIMLKNQNQGSVAFGAVANQKWYVKRNTYLNDDSVGVANAYASNESTFNNNFMIPLSIYGIK